MNRIVLKKLKAPSIEKPNPFSDLWEHEITLEMNSKYQIAAPSGLGKTSLLSFIFGIRDDYLGDILFDETNIKNLSLVHWVSFRRKHLSLMFQDLRLFSNLTALENIQLKQEQTCSVSLNRVKDMAGILSVKTILDKKLGQLSRGEAQRIAILRVLSQPFDFLLLDEPFSHLDPDTQRIALDLIIHQVDRKKKSLLITSHDKDLLTRDFQLLQV